MSYARLQHQERGRANRGRAHLQKRCVSLAVDRGLHRVGARLLPAIEKVGDCRGIIAGGQRRFPRARAHREWYRELFQSCGTSGLIGAGALAGYGMAPSICARPVMCRRAGKRRAAPCRRCSTCWHSSWRPARGPGALAVYERHAGVRRLFRGQLSVSRTATYVQGPLPSFALSVWSGSRGGCGEDAASRGHHPLARSA
jgi:hypothetical protein